jgi:hypothetical protein
MATKKPREPKKFSALEKICRAPQIKANNIFDFFLRRFFGRGQPGQGAGAFWPGGRFWAGAGGLAARVTKAGTGRVVAHPGC